MEKIPLINLFSLPSVFNVVNVDRFLVKNEVLKSSRKRKHSDSVDDLSDITNKLLKKRLIEINNCKLKEVTNHLKINENIDDKRNFILSEPYKYYWLLHGKFYDTSRPLALDKFDEIARKMFSSTFVWLLKECSRTINVSPRDLYSEVVRTEVMFLDKN